MKVSFSKALIAIFLSFSYGSLCWGSTSLCKDVFWGKVNYTDLNSEGTLVRKTQISPIREWSSQSKFDEILVEKSGAHLLTPPDSVQIKIAVLSFLKPTADRVFQPQNTVGFFQVSQGDLKKWIDSKAKHGSYLSISYSVDGRTECEKKVPISH